MRRCRCDRIISLGSHSHVLIILGQDPKVIRDVSYYKDYFSCAEQVATVHAAPSQRIVFYLVRTSLTPLTLTYAPVQISDSQSLKDGAVAAYPDRVVVSGLIPRHVELSGAPTENTFTALDGQNVAIAEMWSFRETDFKLITEESGFGKIRQ